METEPSSAGVKNSISFAAGIAALVILALAAGYYFSSRNSRTPVQEVVTAPQAQQAATSTYATTTFSVVYPADYSVNERYAYDQFEKKPIHGVKFVIPETMATGTNLSANDTGISVEQLPRAKNCTADIYIPAEVKTQTVNEGGIEYSVATTSGAAAGNFYEEQIYAFAASHPCTAVRYFIHSTNIGNYTPSAVREFDRAALLSAFDAIRHTVVLTQQ